MSSLYFLGDDTSYLRIPNNSELNFGTGDFTIEWYQYQTDSNPYPRIFQIGSYSDETISIGVSIEGSTFYLWLNGGSNNIISLTSYKNVWVHFAICRSSGIIAVYMNGTLINEPFEYTNDLSSGIDLVIGNETNTSSNAAFGGYMTYFTWVKGVARYTSNFTVQNNYPELTNDYVLLLKATEFVGTLGNTVVNNNVSTVNQVPPNFGSPTPSTPSNRFSMKSLYTDNSRVYYKPNSLSIGVGSVRNASAKKRRT